METYRIIVSTGWSLSGPSVLEKREAGDDWRQACALADALFAQHAAADMVHLLHGSSADGWWYKSRAIPSWTFNTQEGDN